MAGRVPARGSEGKVRWQSAGVLHQEGTAQWDPGAEGAKAHARDGVGGEGGQHAWGSCERPGASRQG
eukprot:2313573-Pyramimonas_sp.AAC.1